MSDEIIVACCGNCKMYLEHGVCEYFNKTVNENDVACMEWEF